MENEKLEQLIKNAKERATQLLIETENCAYSPFVALLEALNIKASPELLAVPIGFAGGLSGSGHLCGALWASVAAVSIYMKKKIDEERGGGRQAGESFIAYHAELHNKVTNIYKQFVNMFGSPNCKDLNPKFDLVSPEQRKKCTVIVRKSVEITLRSILGGSNER
ncbi:C-GCAxxG-C-C family (seleno)protein [Vulcanisaeta distributa]|uniref:C-GCAxxG-C-C family (seleno)protein n=1 Tax=Vulcanisaeta distributa TaxID=164451 RepID=UPI000B211DB8|nr:C-GCAxxG-C-C family (seleno)protein [Vulcanisaeta distributa]